jgi:hypothetical protein
MIRGITTTTVEGAAAYNCPPTTLSSELNDIER